jgi:hypothetical protein
MTSFSPLPRQRKATYEPHPHPLKNAKANLHPLPNEWDTDYAKRVECEQKQVNTWKGIKKNTWRYGHQSCPSADGYHPKDENVLQSEFSTPRGNGAGGKDTYLLKPRAGAVEVHTIPERHKPSFYKGLVCFEENGELPVEQYRYLTSAGFGEPGNRTKEERKQFNRVLGDANRAMRDFLHNEEARDLKAKKYQKNT